MSKETSIEWFDIKDAVDGVYVFAEYGRLIVSTITIETVREFGEEVVVAYSENGDWAGDVKNLYGYVTSAKVSDVCPMIEDKS